MSKALFTMTNKDTNMQINHMQITLMNINEVDVKK